MPGISVKYDFMIRKSDRQQHAVLRLTISVQSRNEPAGVDIKSYCIPVMKEHDELLVHMNVQICRPLYTVNPKMAKWEKKIENWAAAQDKAEARTWLKYYDYNIIEV